MKLYVVNRSALDVEGFTPIWTKVLLILHHFPQKYTFMIGGLKKNQ